MDFLSRVLARAWGVLVDGLSVAGNFLATLLLSLIHLLGALLMYGFAFIALFIVVEFIPILKLSPPLKYLPPFFLGVAWILYAYFDGLRSGFPYFGGSEVLTLLFIAILIGLALWYMIGGIRSGERKLKEAQLAKTKSSS